MPQLGVQERRIDDNRVPASRYRTRLLHQHVIHGRVGLVGIRAFWQPVFRRDAMQALADFVAAQDNRPWSSAEFRSQDAGEGGLAGALKTADREHESGRLGQISLSRCQVAPGFLGLTGGRPYMCADHGAHREKGW